MVTDIEYQKISCIKHLLRWQEIPSQFHFDAFNFEYSIFFLMLYMKLFNKINSLVILYNNKERKIFILLK